MAHGGISNLAIAANLFRHGLAWSVRLLLLILGTPLMYLSLAVLLALGALDEWAAGALAD